MSLSVDKDAVGRMRQREALNRADDRGLAGIV
jgi:hypothetical protein